MIFIITFCWRFIKMKLEWEEIKTTLLVFGKYLKVLFVLNLLSIPNSFINTCIWKLLQIITVLPFVVSVVSMVKSPWRLSRDLLTISFFECSNGWSVVSVFVSKGLNFFVSVPERIPLLTSRKFIDVSFLYLDPLQIILRGLLF